MQATSSVPVGMGVTQGASVVLQRTIRVKGISIPELVVPIFWAATGGMSLHRPYGTPGFLLGRLPHTEVRG